MSASASYGTKPEGEVLQPPFPGFSSGSIGLLRPPLNPSTTFWTLCLRAAGYSGRNHGGPPVGHRSLAGCPEFHSGSCLVGNDPGSKLHSGSLRRVFFSSPVFFARHSGHEPGREEERGQEQLKV